MIKNSTQYLIASLTLLFTLIPLTTSAQYWWENDEGGVYNIPAEEYNPINHAFGSSGNVIYNKIGFDPSASNPRTMMIKNGSGTITMYDFLGNTLSYSALDNRAIGWDWDNDERNGGIIAASIAEIRVDNTDHTMVYAWSVETTESGGSGWIKLSDLEDSNDIEDILEENKDTRMDILRDGGIDEAIYDEYTIIEAILPTEAEEYYITGGRDVTKTQGKAKYYYTREGYISGIKNIMENTNQRYGVAHNKIPIGANFYKDRNFEQVDVEIYPGVEDEDDYDDDHFFTPISERLELVWGFTVTGAGEKIYSFINNRALVATGNEDVTNQEEEEEEEEEENGDDFIPDPDKVYYIDNPAHNLRLASTGESEDPYTTSTNTTGNDVTWEFVDKGNGYWHIQRAAGGSKPVLRSDASSNADMQETSSSGKYTYYDFPASTTSGTYYASLPDGPLDYRRLKVDNNGNVKMVSDEIAGTWVSFKFTEASTISSGIENIAPNGTASQSSTSYEGSASRAIDKNTNGVYYDGSVTHTENERRPHWQVEWNDIYEIDEIKIYNRTDDCCTDRLSDFKVFVIDDDSGDINFTETYSVMSGSSMTINTDGAKGNRVKIRLNETNFLSLAEVEVYGTVSSNLVVASLTEISTATEATVDNTILFPNPASDYVEIYINEDVKELHIYDSLGRSIESHDINYELIQNNTFSITTSHLESGLYTIQLVLVDGTFETHGLLVKQD